MKQYIIPEQLANAVLQYLGKQPYVEVATLISGLMQLKEISPQTSTGPTVSLVPKGE